LWVGQHSPRKNHRPAGAARPYDDSAIVLVRPRVTPLLRQYFPKGTELRQHTEKYFDQVAAQINRRPRTRYGYAIPEEMVTTLLMQ
jgi:hypothetical protein